MNEMQFKKLSFSPTGEIGGNTHDNDKSSNVFLRHTLEPLEPLEPIRTFPTPVETRKFDCFLNRGGRERERGKEYKSIKSKESKAFQNFLFNRKFFNARDLVAIPAVRPGGLNE